MKTLWDKLEKKEIICATVLVAYFCFLLLWPLSALMRTENVFPWCLEHLSLGTIVMMGIVVILFVGEIAPILIIGGIYCACVLLMIFGVLFSFKKPRAIWIVYIICSLDVVLALILGVGGGEIGSGISMILFDIGVIILAGMIDRRKTLSFIPKEKVQDL